MFHLVRLSTAISCYQELWPCIRPLQNLTLCPPSSSYWPTRIAITHCTVIIFQFTLVCNAVKKAILYTPPQYKPSTINSRTVQCNGICLTVNCAHYLWIVLIDQCNEPLCHPVLIAHSNLFNLSSTSTSVNIRVTVRVSSCRGYTAIYQIYPVQDQCTIVSTSIIVSGMHRFIK